MKYRFKTEEEFIQEFGKENWRDKAGLNRQGEMDYLLGQPLEKYASQEKITEAFTDGRDLHISGRGGYYRWSIYPRMIIATNLRLLSITNKTCR